MKKFPLRHALTAGLIAGTLDITAAFIQTYIKTSKGPEAVLKFIASGAFGKEAFTGGNSMIVWGLVFHYIIAISFTLFFFWLAVMAPKILSQKILTAIVYSTGMWSVTQFIVIPLSKIPKRQFNFSNTIIAISILVMCIGIPITYLAARAINTNKH
ncbi:MAG: hypothetical protein JST87_05725 [Bacteroidetes bacterium]|nr:hypothetical protein [Bacteroidota bacterium]